MRSSIRLAAALAVVIPFGASFATANASTEGPWKPSSAYEQPTASNPDGPGLTLSWGWNGSKVRLVQEELYAQHFLTAMPKVATNKDATNTAIRAFQKKAKLTPNGDIDAKTFDALGIKKKTGYSFDVDGYKKSSRVKKDATRTQRVDAMIAWAKEQQGRGYTWGGVAPINTKYGKQGYDCSGLLLQAMRAGGLDPKGVANRDDLDQASDLSFDMYKNTRFQDGSLSHLQKGDFIYYSNSAGKVGHVSMYIGNSQVINATPEGGVWIASVTNTFGWDKVAGVNRPFAL